MKRLTAATPILIATAFASAPASAHHSQSMFDTTKEIVIEGTVARFDWVNPHMFSSSRRKARTASRRAVRVTSASGETATWQLESWGSPYVLSRKGVTQDQFVVRTEVRLAGTRIDSILF